jgi:hypothetical protein
MALAINKQIIDKSSVVDRGIFIEVLENIVQKQIALYVRVEQVHATKDSAMALVSFCEIDTKQNIFGATYNFSVSLDGDNFIKQAYQYIKTLPEFSDAINC